MSEFRLTRFLAALLPGTLSGVLIVIFSVSFSAMIFSGELAGHISDGITLAITAAVVVGLILAIFCRSQPMISVVDEDTAPIFALLAALVVASMPAGSTDAQVFSTVVAAIIFSTLLSGIGLALLGVLRFGGFIQFLPHSVMGGYFAAVGWLLVVGGLMVAEPTLTDYFTDESPTEHNILPRVLPALAIALSLILLRSRVSAKWLLPATISAGLLLWYSIWLLLGYSAGDALAWGYLIGPLATGGNVGVVPLSGLVFSEVQWFPLLSNLGSTATIFMISILSIMLTMNGLANLHQREVDMNRELIVAGVANVLSGGAGGMTALPSYTLSALAAQNGTSGNRYTALVAVFVCALLYLFGMDYIAYIPRAILAGILIYLGLSLLQEWLLEGLKKFSALEYLVIPIILLVTVFAGFLQGVFIGMVSAIVLFVVKYSRTSAIRYVATGREFASTVDRNPLEQDALRRRGDELLIVALQGYLFFGTAGLVYTRLRDRLDQGDEGALKYLVLDFSSVSGLDASAAINFQKISRLAASKNLVLLMSALGGELSSRLGLTSTNGHPSGGAEIMPDLDHALEWCEEEILRDGDGQQPAPGCFEQLSSFLSDNEIKTLQNYLQRRTVVQGQVLTEHGDHSTELYFLESCDASAFLKTSTGKTQRVRRSKRGTVFGELGFYLETPRTASVVVDSDGVVYALNRQSLLLMEERDPEVAAGLNRYMAMLLSERLMFTTRTLRAVSA